MRRLHLPIVLLLALCGPALAHLGIEEQIAEVTHAIEARPRDAALRLKRGELHRAHGDWALAEADYLAARGIDPQLDAVDLCMGSMLLESGTRLDEARAALDRFLARRPGHAEGLVTRARVLVMLGDRAAAVRDYDAAIRALGPPGRPRPEYYLERADALTALGDARLAEAVAGLDEGLALLGQPITLQMKAIDLEMRLGRHDGALARVEQILSRPGRREQWLRKRGEIQEAAGRKDEARRSYEEALAAIERLPEGRRALPATRELESELRLSLSRLAAPAAAR